MDRLSSRTGEPLTTSELAQVEVIRSIRRVDAGSLPAARQVLASLYVMPLSRWVVEVAASLDDPLLSSVDALHVTSALSVSASLHVVIAYDRRLAATATAADMQTIQPGA